MRWVVLALALVLLSGCTSAVKMRNQDTHEVVECGPYPSGGLAGFNTPRREAQCINDYKERGFIRVP